ncbi:hypothetical protein [Rhodoblastus sp.]|uniref:hypothetical protein n=1 Tax=Rhodoblastus sp. TaxID=1962975 RepID=UPI003F982155
MSKQNSFIRTLVTSALSNVLDLMSVVVVFFAGGVGYEAGSARGEALVGGIVGVLVGLVVSALLFGVVYVLIEIAEQSRSASITAKAALEQNGRLLAAIEQRLAQMELHLARLDDAQISDHAAKSVATAIAGA